MSFILKRQDLHNKMLFWYLKIIADWKGTDIWAFVTAIGKNASEQTVLL